MNMFEQTSVPQTKNPTCSQTRHVPKKLYRAMQERPPVISLDLSVYCFLATVPPFALFLFAVYV